MYICKYIYIYIVEFQSSGVSYVENLHRRLQPVLP